MFGMSIYAQANYNGPSSDVRYQYFEMTNKYGNNFVDFKLTYDNYTGYDNCNNNILIIAQGEPINIYFQVYLDGYKVYDGWAKLGPYDTYYLDDAFYDCSAIKCINMCCGS